MSLSCAQNAGGGLLVLGLCSKNDCAGSATSKRERTLGQVPGTVRREISSADWLHRFLLDPFLVLRGAKLETQTKLWSVLFLVSWTPS